MKTFFSGMADVLKRIVAAGLGLIGVILAGFSWLLNEIGGTILNAGQWLVADTENEEELEEVESEEPET